MQSLPLAGRPHASFQNRLLLLVLPLVVTLLAAVVALAWYATKERLIGESRNAMTVAVRNLDAWLDLREQRLREAASVLAKDYGFRSAIASGDAATGASALDNLRRRIAADRLTLIDLDRNVLIEAAGTAGKAGTLALPAELDLLDSQPPPAWYAALPEGMQQYTMVPVLAPDPIAWIVVARTIHPEELRAFRRQSTLPIDVTLAEWDDRSAWRGISTLRGEELRRFPVLLAGHLDSRASERAPSTTSVDASTYVTVHRHLPAADGSPEPVSLVQYSVDAALEPYQTLFLFLLAVGGAAIVGSTIALIFIARSLTAPIRRLDEAAEQIRTGNYGMRVDIATGDELGRLGETFNAMVDAVASREQRILEQSLKDPLTGLPNLVHFGRQAEERVRLAREAASCCSVLLVEVDRVPEIRGTLGHELADQVLASVADRLSLGCKQDDLVARIAGPSFALLLNQANAETAVTVAQRVVAALSEPVTIGGVDVDLLVRVGVATYPHHGGSAGELLRHAEVAAGHGSPVQPVVVYDTTADPYRPELLSLVGEMRAGIGRGEFELHLQPKVDLVTRRCVGAEALVRWRHPRLGRLPPAEFIPLAERTGVIQELTRWAIGTAVDMVATWEARGHCLGIAVNLSAKDLRQPDLPAFVASHLKRSGVRPGLLVLEITESAVMDRPEQALGVLEALRALGVRLAIDDFGTGYSSLAYLKRLPVTELKVDRSFVSNVVGDSDDQVIVRTTLDLARDLGLDSVAEGVEDGECLELLNRLGCRYAQGFHISPPLPLEQFNHFLATSAWGAGEAPGGNVRLLPVAR